MSIPSAPSENLDHLAPELFIWDTWAQVHSGQLVFVAEARKTPYAWLVDGGMGTETQFSTPARIFPGPVPGGISWNIQDTGNLNIQRRIVLPGRYVGKALCIQLDSSGTSGCTYFVWAIYRPKDLTFIKDWTSLFL